MLEVNALKIRELTLAEAQTRLKGHENMINTERMLRFEAVRAALSVILGLDYSTHLGTNDAMEPVLEIHVMGAAWMIGMMDEPVWGYDLEADDGLGGSWEHVKTVSLELPEASEPNVVAQHLLEAVEHDRRELGDVEAAG